MFENNDNIDENQVMAMVQQTPLYGTIQITYDFQNFIGVSVLL